MKLLILMVVLLLIATVVVAAIKEKQKGTNEGKSRDLRQKRPLSAHEQKMFFRLVSTFPEHIVLAQVSFSALLRSKEQGTRNGYNRKMADFVLCDKTFQVLAVIELDDKSHDGNEEKDAMRDEFLTAAGYKVLRYKSIPDESTLLNDLTPKTELM